MSLQAYTGPPGAGKSYALMADVIVPAVMKGRRVLTNLDGVKPDLVRQYCIDKGATAPGEVVLFDGHDSIKEGFFPRNNDDQDATLRPGDLFVMDEVRMYWPRRGAFPGHLVNFIRYHRHFTAADGTSTDMVLATQLASDFHQDFRGVTERTFRFKKLGTIGLKDRYVWEMWEGHLQSKGESVATGNGKYKDEIFQLYKSYSGGVGKETAVDTRANVFKSPKTWAIVAGMVLALLAGIGGLFWIKGAAETDTANGAVAVQAVKPSQATARAPAAPMSPVPVYSPPEDNDEFRIAGDLEIAGVRTVFLENGNDQVIADSAVSYSEWQGVPVYGQVDGKRVRRVAPGGSKQSGSPFSSPVG